MLPRSIAKWIWRNTIVSDMSLTPEVRLHLITEASPLWMSTPEHCPLLDPYWAFYWPGGQAVTRYLLDNPRVVNSASVLDFGTGCGSASIACSMHGVRRIMANDIDLNALIATSLNYRLNNASPVNVRFEQKNLLEKDSNEAKELLKSSSNPVVILGDMFYDSDFAMVVFTWLKNLQHDTGARILVGDPDRHPLAEKKYLDKYTVAFEKRVLAEYPLPGYVTKEHYGFTTAKVFELAFT